MLEIVFFLTLGNKSRNLRGGGEGEFILIRSSKTGHLNITSIISRMSKNSYPMVLISGGSSDNDAHIWQKVFRFVEDILLH